MRQAQHSEGRSLFDDNDNFFEYVFHRRKFKNKMGGGGGGGIWSQISEN